MYCNLMESAMYHIIQYAIHTVWMSTTVHMLHSCFQEKCYQLVHFIPCMETFIGQYVNAQQ